jgi:putative phosphoribosyl transferase
LTGVLAFPGQTPIALAAGQGSLQGLLTLPERLSALVVLTHAGPAPAACDDALALILQHAGIGTLTLDLLTPAEERFADLQHNVSLLARRLLDGLALLKQRMLLGELPTLPIGLSAAGDCSPVVLRVAALRDHDIYALVCRGGLIDLAGVLYLRALASPLLLLVDEDDERSTMSNRRALRELACPNELRPLATKAADDPASPAAFAAIARATALWFIDHLPATSPLAATPAVGPAAG